MKRAAAVAESIVRGQLYAQWRHTHHAHLNCAACSETLYDTQDTPARQVHYALVHGCAVALCDETCEAMLRANWQPVCVDRAGRAWRN